MARFVAFRSDGARMTCINVEQITLVTDQGPDDTKIYVTGGHHVVVNEPLAQVMATLAGKDA
ncbi:hypothetical protein [Phenylobacterium sp.]|uniref:hypothetical protein n=1 Tax=Phenylobacterium sp. TaxID=1871053 RepID=UPI0025FA7AB2|nr:hypothetical protein [Phenylobacterium sp.]